MSNNTPNTDTNSDASRSAAPPATPPPDGARTPREQAREQDREQAREQAPGEPNNHAGRQAQTRPDQTRPDKSHPETRPAETRPAETRPAGPGPNAEQPAAPQTPPQTPAIPPPQPTPAEVAEAEIARAQAQVRAHVDADVDEAMRSEMDAAMRDAAPPDAPKRTIRGPRLVKAGREHRTGTVVSVGPTDVFIEFGPKELGVVQRIEYKTEDELPKVGDEIEVVVNRYEAAESLFICSKPGAVVKAEWELLEPGQTVEARVTGVNKGGLELEIAGHRAFMPAGQVSLDRIEDLSVFVGEKLACQVQRVDRRGKGNIVLSRRDILQRERQEAASRLQETLHEGQVVEGVVRKIMPFGAFVDIGGIDGLVHLSDLTHDRVGHGEKAVERYVSAGQKVTAQVLKIDWSARRISLGMKQLQDDPFKAQLAEVQEGAELSGKVTKIMEFGAFVEIAPGVEGLVHISELDYRRVNRVEDVLQANEVVQVKVLKIDPDSRRVSLSIKALKAPPVQKGGKGKKEDRGPSAEEILKETPKLRRMREQAKAKQKKATGGLGDLGGLNLGEGLGSLKL